MDVRGSAYRTVDEIFSLKYSLGSADAVDHLEIISVLTQLPFIDKERVGVWGWSYGK
jgi:dipeptidyl-peptidase-4